MDDVTAFVPTVTPYQAIGIPIALIGAVFLSLGAQFQSRGVTKVRRGSGQLVGVRQLLKLLGRPSWLLGTAMLGLAIVLQLTSLAFAPLIVVQPLGAVALVITAFLTARTTHQPLGRKARRAIGLCVGGVGFFVLVAAIFASERPISERELGIILGILLGVFALLGVAFALLRSRFRAGYSIVTAGVLFGFVATLALVVINRIITGNFEFLTVLCIIGLLAAAGIGSYFVQNAYASGPPDLVIAGLTVIDPLVAVGIGILVLGEASGAPWFAVVAFLAAAVVAITGVRQLSKYHPHEA